MRGHAGVVAIRLFGRLGSRVTIRDLDRLVSKTELTPVSKKVLRSVRKAIVAGRTGETDIGRASWSVEVQSLHGTPLRIKFSFKREN